MAAVYLAFIILFTSILSNAYANPNPNPNANPTESSNPTQTSLSPQYTDDLTFREAILNSTNLYRYEHSAGYIYWNTSLASFAKKHSSTCKWEHTKNNPNGENLAQNYADVTSAVDAWGDERSQYKFSNTNPTGFSESTGHFTQLVWKSTQAVGCGYTNCNGKNDFQGVFLVCEYWPAGNVLNGNSGGNQNQYFIDNVSDQQNTGKGFNEASATKGVTGGTPTATGTGVTFTTTAAAVQLGLENISGGHWWLTSLIISLLSFI